MATSIRRCTATAARPVSRLLVTSPRQLLPPLPSTRSTLRHSFSTTPPPSTKYHLLFYTYVDNMVERRTPIRPLHLSHSQAYVDRQQLLLAGACPPEVKDAVLCFAASREEVEEYAKKDPYVKNGLVTDWKVKEWTVVMGTAMKK